MLEFHEKRRLQHFLHNRYFLSFMILPIGFLAYAAHNAYEAERETYERRIELEAELGLLEERAHMLEEDIAQLEDPHGVEAELRKRYDVGWEGEEAIILIEEDVVEKPTHASESADEPSWWDTMANWF